MITIVLAVIIAENKVLIVRRARKDKAVPELTWAFPGGKVKPGETTRQAVTREVKEETGLHIIVESLVHLRQIPNTNILANYFKCSPMDSECVDITVNRQEIQDFAWTTGPNALSRFRSDVAGPIRALLKELTGA